MKLVINIPEEDYKNVQSNEKIIILKSNLSESIKIGTPLLSFFEDIKAEIEAKKEEENVCIEYDLRNGAFDDVLDIINRKVNELKSS